MIYVEVFLGSLFTHSLGKVVVVIHLFTWFEDIEALQVGINLLKLVRYDLYDHND